MEREPQHHEGHRRTGLMIDLDDIKRGTDDNKHAWGATTGRAGWMDGRTDEQIYHKKFNT